MDTKERILMYVKRFETDSVMGLPVDRSRRALLRRVHGAKDYRASYDELIKSGDLHESGTGSKGDPSIVVLGPAPEKPIKPLSFPHSAVSALTLFEFIERIHAYYEAKGWSQSTLDVKSEISKALSVYQPDRPY